MKARTKLTKLWSILLVLVMVVGMLPTVALAEEPATASETADFTADDTDAALKLLNDAKTEDAEDSTWNPDKNILTLNGVNFETSAATAVILPDGVTIVLNGDNTITGGNASSGASYGIYAEGNLTIQGTGTLTVTAGTAGGKRSNDRSCGIYTGKALTMSSGIVKAYAGTSAKASLGIYSKGNFTISGGEVKATGGTAKDDGSFGIDAEGEVIINGGTVMATGGKGLGSDGIYSGSHKVTINDGTVMAIGGDTFSPGWSVGIYAINGNVTINDGSVTIAASSRANGTFLFKGNKVTYGDCKTISFNKNTGSGEMSAYTYDVQYTLPANGFTAPEGQQFKCWSVDGEEKAVGDKITVSGDTTVTAVWEDITYTVNVTNGTASPIQAAAGTTVSLKANAATTGQVFDKWVVESGSITLEDATREEITFEMPAEEVSVRATYTCTHTNKTNVSEKSSTCIEKGWDAYSKCDDCEQLFDKDANEISEIPYRPLADHNYTATEKKPEALKTAGTCKDEALYLYSCEVCGKVAPSEASGIFRGDLDPNNHAGGTTTVKASEPDHKNQVDGYTGDTKCLGCNEIIGTGTSIPAGAHTPSSTWSSDGDYHWKTCSVEGCGVIIEDSKEAHTASDWIIDTPATSTTSGSKHKKCTVCELKLETGTIPATGSGGGGGGGVSTYANTVNSAKNGTVTVNPKSAAKGATVTITVKPDEGFELDTLKVVDKNGDEVKVTEKDGKYTFTMPASKVTVEATFAEIVAAPENPFVDVAESVYYYDAVLWAAENGITGGVDDTHFAPNATCTRAQIVTFLWRAAGSPGPENMSSFADVSADSYYAKAVAWAVENGITDGTGNGMFSPNATCTRAQAMTFLWRAQKSPASDSVNPFADVAADAYYNNAVLWAVTNGITDGTSDTTFSPSNDCTRAQIVTFLWRALAE